MELNGIKLEPGMILTNSKGHISIVIPFKKNDVAFISYSNENSWSTSPYGKTIKIQSHPIEGLIDSGKVLWEVTRFEVTYDGKVVTMNEDEFMEFIKTPPIYFVVRKLN